MPDILEIDSVVKYFGEKLLLSDIYLKCQTKDIVAILGRNGAGKSTFLKIIFGTQLADNKFIQFNGKKIDRLYQVKNKIAYLPQDNFIPQNFTVKECLDAFNFSEQSRQLLKEMFRASLGNKIGELSSGQSRTLEIQIILNTNSSVILLDEPFRGLSPIMIDNVKQMIKSAAENKCIILTDQNYRQVLDLANSVYLLTSGKLHIVKAETDLVNYNYLSSTKCGERTA